MESLKEIWLGLQSGSLLGSEYWRYVVMLVCVFLGLVLGRIARYMMERRGERLKEDPKRPLSGVLCTSLARPMTVIGFYVGLYAGFQALTPSEQMADIIGTALRTLLAVTIGYAVYRMVDIIDHFLSGWAAKTESKLDDMLVPMARKSLRIVTVIVVIMDILEQLAGAENIKSILAGLGIGGLAVALAAQDTIKNFFGSMMILLDKPFQIGDRIILGGHDGPVEEVGFRSTKIRTLDGHLVSVPNSVVVNEMVQNIGQRPFIKRVMNVTITYDTPREKVERAVQILKEILDNHEGMRPDFEPRVFFSDFNADSLNILVIYWYHPPDYWAFMAFSEKVNLEIFERFNAEGIEFAFPTQTLYLANDDKRQLAVRLLNANSRMPEA